MSSFVFTLAARQSSASTRVGRVSGDGYEFHTRNGDNMATCTVSRPAAIEFAKALLRDAGVQLASFVETPAPPYRSTNIPPAPQPSPLEEIGRLYVISCLERGFPNSPAADATREYLKRKV